MYTCPTMGRSHKYHRKPMKKMCEDKWWIKWNGYQSWGWTRKDINWILIWIDLVQPLVTLNEL